jgi:AcrR family transcriptional regulator
MILIMLGTPSRDRVAERREATRREIVDAAWELAREHGLAEITLRQVAERVGMQAPSLYSHVASKHAIYDAMFGEAWTQFLDGARELDTQVPDDLPGMLLADARYFFDFATGDPVRNQLMNQRTIPGFEPSPEAYAPAVEVLDEFATRLADHGITAQEDIDLLVAIVGGLADSQLANDPGGDRWGRLIERAVDMYVRDLESRSLTETTRHPAIERSDR